MWCVLSFDPKRESATTRFATSQKCQILENNKSVTDQDMLTCPVDLFSKGQDIIFTELKVDNFPVHSIRPV